MINNNRFLIIVGTNRNAGKTTFGCNLIRNYSNKFHITGIKISPHFHELEADDKILVKTENFVIVEETKRGTGKDSSRMLKAGARQVFYVQVWDSHLEEAMRALLTFIDPDSYAVIESGWARSVFHPGLFLILNRKGDPITKKSIEEYRSQADLWINFDGEKFDFSVDDIYPSEEGWTIRE